MDILEIIKNGYAGYAGYLWNEITNPSWHNYFYWLLLVSGFFFILEILKPWRKDQKIFRKDFWLDFFYMFFNFFIFSLIIYNAASDVVVNLFNDGIKALANIDLKQINPLYNWPLWAVLLTGFIVRDFVQWWTHRLLHRSEKLWQFHKVHHSVEEMGFAAHLRYHWMETLVYRTIEYLPLALIGIGLYDFFVIHIFTLAIGHYNHSNISIKGKYTGAIIGALIGIGFYFGLADLTLLQNTEPFNKLGFVLVLVGAGYFVLGPIMKKLFNSPEMHIWHHAKEIPDNRKYGVNFGISLAIWDYIFGTNYIPYEGGNIELGFDGMENFPDNFIDQAKYGL
jgi:sterol desaturase/sphingolipid hydroxylase (fatty acid hydroxylase superfamily)